MEFVNNLRIIRKHIWLVLLTTLVAGGSAAAIDRLHFGRTVYTSSALILLNPSVTNRAVVATNRALDPANRTTTLDIDTLAATYNAYVTSFPFLQTVIPQYHLARTVPDLASSITTRRLPSTVFYQITVTGYDGPETVRDTNALATAFVQADAQYLGSPSALNPALTAAGATFYGQLIAQISQQLTTIYNDPHLPIDQKAARAGPLQNRLQDALGVQARLTPPPPPPPAVSLYGSATGPDMLTRTALVENLVLFALLGGFVVGLALALLREYLDYTLRDADEVAETLAVPVLATIGLFHGQGASARLSLPRLLSAGPLNLLTSGGFRPAAPTAAASRDALVTLSRPFDAGTEAFRNLRTGIIFTGAVNKVRTMVVTSALPREGKSAVAANLAVVMAQAGERVILVDANMRAPVQHAFFGLPNTSGLSTLYLGDRERLAATALATLQQTPIPNLRLLDAGQIAPNPAELLASARTADIVSALAEQADFVIFDTPAMGLLTDAVILASHADGTVVVTSARTTRRDQVRAALERLTAVNARVLGLVLNKADVPGARSVRYYRGARRALTRAGSASPGAGTTAATTISPGHGALTPPSHVD